LIIDNIQDRNYLPEEGRKIENRKPEKQFFNRKVTQNFFELIHNIRISQIFQITGRKLVKQGINLIISFF